MSPGIKFIIFQTLIILPFILGIMCRKKTRQPQILAKRIINFNLSTLEPCLALWSIWALDLNRGLVILPLAGFFLVGAGFFFGILFLPLTGLKGRSRPSFLISASLANHGFTMGTFLCYFMMGEAGLGYSVIFTSYFAVYTYFLIFSYARRVSGKGASLSLGEFFLNVQNIPLFAVVLAVGLRIYGISRPHVYFPVDYIIFASIGLYYFTLGVNFKTEDLVLIKGENVLLGLIKFLILPGLAFVGLLLLKLEGIAACVILLQSFMPAAIYSVITTMIFDLDFRLASGLFVVNTLVFLFAVLPFLIIFRSILFNIP